MKKKMRAYVCVHAMHACMHIFACIFFPFFFTEYFPFFPLYLISLRFFSCFFFLFLLDKFCISLVLVVARVEFKCLLVSLHVSISFIVVVTWCWAWLMNAYFHHFIYKYMNAQIYEHFLYRFLFLSWNRVG